MEQKINRRVLELSKMEREDLLIVRHECEREITARINDINAINSELNRRHELAPEFGHPILSREVRYEQKHRDD